MPRGWATNALPTRCRFIDRWVPFRRAGQSCAAAERSRCANIYKRLGWAELRNLSYICLYLGLRTQQARDTASTTGSGVAAVPERAWWSRSFLPYRATRADRACDIELNTSRGAVPHFLTSARLLPFAFVITYNKILQVIGCVGTCYLRRSG